MAKSDLPTIQSRSGLTSKDASNIRLQMMEKQFHVPDAVFPAANLVAQGPIHSRLQIEAPAMDEDLRKRNIALFFKYLEYENARDYDNLEKLFHPTEFRATTYFGSDPIAPRALTRMLRGLFRSFPDWYMTVSEI